ncbi:hypothetical protein J6590_106697 [Homalodisca vitripennis]|nr:hypothetical protein J6590_106697 [Homalodisca vitripennis]
MTSPRYVKWPPTDEESWTDRKLDRQVSEAKRQASCQHGTCADMTSPRYVKWPPTDEESWTDR